VPGVGVLGQPRCPGWGSRLDPSAQYGVPVPGVTPSAGVRDRSWGEFPVAEPVTGVGSQFPGPVPSSRSGAAAPGGIRVDSQCRFPVPGDNS